MSRWDSHGMVWQEAEKEKKKGGGYVTSVRPAIPETNWRCPREFPNLEAAKIISIDLETRDPSLIDKGPGPRRRNSEGGFIAGLAVGVGPNKGEQWYFPINHEGGKHNFDEDMVMMWARKELCRPNQPKLGANLMYDLDWLYEYGVEVKGPFYDVQIAEPLIDENAFSYSLDRLAGKYLNEGKEDEAMYEWLSLAFGGRATRRDQGGNIWRAPAELAGPYAESDVRLPFLIWEQQQKIIRAEDLESVMDIETQLIPLLLAMRRRGVRVDTAKARQLDRTLMAKAKEYRQRLEGMRIDPWSNDTIASFCDKNGIRYRRTKQGNPSFRSDWLEGQENENLRLVHAVRRLEKHAGTFIEGTIFNNVVGDRIHCQFNQLRSDDYGAVSGRFSSSNPNLQNIPARDGELGPLIRGLFIPDPDEVWESDDWSQIEYRLLVHYASGEGAEETRRRYRNDPSTDFHAYVAEISGIDRRPAKSINFGLVYGMGEPTLAGSLGRTVEEVRPIFDLYHKTFPFVRSTYDKVSQRAKTRGWIKTLFGRRRRFNLWEPNDWNLAREASAKPHDAAVQEWGEGNIRRAGAHKALNALLQGGAADIMKKAMVDIWNSGVCDVLGAPLLTVHDELNWTRPRTAEADEAHRESLAIMENCVSLRVPLKVDNGTGASWGEAK